MKKITLAALAHVDAGKTTLSESFLYQSGKLRKRGRVDHHDTFLDYDLQERTRGITIYLKQALFPWKNTEFTLLDTPGHIDFSAEMERTLQVLDYAIVLISAIDGVQSHTRTIWKLCETYRIPLFIFINKMDITHQNKEVLLHQLQSELSPNCIDFTNPELDTEELALCDDALLESYLQSNQLNQQNLIHAIENRRVFPCYFGSALKSEGIVALLDGLDQFTAKKIWPSDFGARVFKISRDLQGNRLTHIKITGGTLKNKALLDNQEKVDQIRIYSGNKFIMVDEAGAGTVCCLKGPQNIQAHQGLGFEHKSVNPILSSCLSYRMILPEGMDRFQIYPQLKQLQEEDPQLQFSCPPHQKDIQVQLMGEIQVEILKQQIQDRFSIQVNFDQGSVRYKETILETVEGMGHYEPLRHYAEVHLLLEPAKLGSGIQIEANCPYDTLEAHWQKLILSILDENEHLGVLTGSPLTDMKITLLAGKAHLKHTESTDFRQATLRALRQGLKSTVCCVLEPVYRFEMEVSAEYTSRALFDLEMMQSEHTIRQSENGSTLILGTAPVFTMQNYHTTLRSYTKGTGKLSCVVDGYRPCQDQQKVIDEMGYDADSDLDNPADSIFCSHGAGFTVKWNEVERYMHIERQYHPNKKEADSSPVHRIQTVNEEELRRVMNRTYKIKERPKETQKTIKRPEMPEHMPVILQEPLIDCMLVDGYNMILSWQSLKELAKVDLAAAREQLIHQLSNYHGTQKGIMIVVFDAYLVKDNPGSVLKRENIHVVYTRTAQTADMFIERTTHQLAEKYRITVATSDAMEQLIILGQGALRLSSRELEARVLQVKKETTQKTEILAPRPMAELKERFDKKHQDD